MSTAPGRSEYDDAGVRRGGGVGGWLLAILLVIAVVAALIGAVLLGPFGLAIGIPVVVVLFLIFSSASGGPAAGA
jgi:hypothetical protein